MQAQEENHRAHVSTGTYVKIALVLGVITAIEFAIVYSPQLKAVVLPMLFILSALKFGLVAGYFMHLKFDPRLLTGTFAVGLGLALAIAVAMVFVNRA